MIRIVLSAICTLVALPAWAEFVRVEATGTVAEAADRLEAAVTGAGAKVFARVDHGAGAASVDMELADAQLLVFGNPKLGTPALQADLRAGLVLPLRVLVFDDGGQTVLLYEAPADMFADYDVPADAEVVKMMAGALGKLTAAAAGN
ncbi:MAG: DUF302 domain-containing protein [Rhodobacteraceae bacterium]|nr:DUF302 domain-containing protein [Alphaproteobacteria bacterium]NNF70886.1 DUF302 domain-containing protein [Paracoccaceae bacterium]NNK66077.1 DUF302 domain-containing protein [Paracoccaceae bacterium]